MKNNQKKFCDYLACYGSQIDSWPEELQGWGFQALREPRNAALYEEEKRFEQLLRRRPPVGPMNPRFADRIIAAAYNIARTPEEGWQFLQFVKEANPVALAATLVIGFTLGFGLVFPATFNQQASIQAYSDEDGATL